MTRAEAAALVAAQSGDALEVICRLVAERDEAREALRRCLDYIPGSEVRNWPSGFRLKAEALKAARAALKEKKP